MLKSLLTPFTAPGAAGTVFRDIFIMAGTIIALLGALGVLTPEQADALNSGLKTVSDQWPTLLLLGGTLMATGMSVYRALFKSRTPEGEAIGHAVDKAVANDSLPANTPIGSVELKTPMGMDNITLPVAPVK